jgi:hypothetical protein
MAEHGVTDCRFAELPRHRDVLRVIEVLVAEEHDFPFQEGVAYRALLPREQWLFEIDAFDFGADM